MFSRNGNLRNLFVLDKFKFVYYMIALATAQHTAWGAATTMQGAQPENASQATVWWLQGLAFAIAVDFTMVMVATKIRNGGSASQYIGLRKLQIPVNWYVITFAAVAVFSTYFQLLYAWAHAQELIAVGGVASEWVERLQGLVNARIVIAPFALPVIATLYTIGGFGKGGESQPKGRNGLTQPRNSVAQPETISVERVAQPALPKPDMKQLPDVQRLADEDGNMTIYMCPGCGAQLSKSGWSRHKRQCELYLSLTMVESE